MHSHAMGAVSIFDSVAASISLRRVSLAFSPERLLLDDVSLVPHAGLRRARRGVNKNTVGALVGMMAAERCSDFASILNKTNK